MLSPLVSAQVYYLPEMFRARGRYERRQPIVRWLLRVIRLLLCAVPGPPLVANHFWQLIRRLLVSVFEGCRARVVSPNSKYHLRSPPDLVLDLQPQLPPWPVSQEMLRVGVHTWNCS